MDISMYKPKRRIEQKHLLNLKDYSAADIYEILYLAQKLKNSFRRGKKCNYLKHKTLAMIFSAPSTRTRLAFETGMHQLGGYSIFLADEDMQFSRGESMRDTAGVLSRYGIDGVVLRAHSQSDVDELAKYGNFPVINGMTDEFHPCQALSDIFTVWETFGRLEGKKLAYFGDGGNSTASSLILAGAKTGMKVCVCSPKEYAPNPDVVALAQNFGDVTVTTDTEEAAADADVIYTNVFFAMDQERDAKKEAALMPYQVNSKILHAAQKDAVFMHSLPARRGEEVTESVIDSTHSVIFEQAENKLHTQKAILTLLLGKK